MQDTFNKLGGLWKTLGPMDRLRYEEMARFDRQRVDMQRGEVLLSLMFFFFLTFFFSLSLVRPLTLPFFAAWT